MEIVLHNLCSKNIETIFENSENIDIHETFKGLSS